MLSKQLFFSTYLYGNSWLWLLSVDLPLRHRRVFFFRANLDASAVLAVARVPAHFLEKHTLTHSPNSAFDSLLTGLLFKNAQYFLHPQEHIWRKIGVFNLLVPHWAMHLSPHVPTGALWGSQGTTYSHQFWGSLLTCSQVCLLKH